LLSLSNFFFYIIEIVSKYTFLGDYRVNLPSFVWLWRIAAWSMGLSLLAYLILGVTGINLFSKRQSERPRPSWLRMTHYIIGWVMVGLVLLLLAIGIVGTLGHYGTLGHSGHLIAGLSVVALVLLSAGSSTQISSMRPWARAVHVGTNLVLFVGLTWVSLTGWQVVQKYLP
jgi:ABC-type tungstate transport system substrate-binding protein